ncbi:16S rRNA (guanine(966)-N(2))-methyltransferase RsmD [Arthrobacter psychrochitiniphilus]|uniref:16S rRNA (Guanine(966)-N(2))-methyltransferase RsmD n=1 Tax=Arthrobacter psychrochitiniphilus TaxID=291045 RepID=A0A2V3DML6_9MICC|nr:16S rRNA (guanine(966)-N(2))-methyltransferase RsmD [Arthrobacter psychrochitiniphilus]NYG18078.1 16S rRNA (guanine966-N2)-methyltransferase [Arthrobacter psychrochitiniphilus]PXA64203.1 16S rRNA (guanine(966)-N(2))-methyltransferase RsmD [Arthrobacter psychrochitiniphilus]
MSRIVAGAAGGSPLVSVPGEGTRPTTDRVKEALFSRLESMNMLAGTRVLDLYAGSGSLGVESASRGAASVELIEFNDKAAAVCQRNAELANKVIGSKIVKVQRAKVELFLDRGVEAGADPWGLVFMDPPYPLTETELSLVLELLAPRLSPFAVVVVERSARTPEPAWPAGLERFAEKKYGETRLWFAEPAAAGD